MAPPPVDVLRLTFQQSRPISNSGGRTITIIKTIDPNVKPASVVLYFYMRARDLNAVGVVYRYWVVPNEPDVTGALYDDEFSGMYKNFGDFANLGTFTSMPVIG